MRKIIALTAAATAFLGAATASYASEMGRPCTTAPKSQWLSMAAIKTKIEAQGYKVRNTKLKGACGEVYAVDKKGKRAELFVDPANAKIVGRED